MYSNSGSSLAILLLARKAFPALFILALHAEERRIDITYAA